jgi:hypothetical protein
MATDNITVTTEWTKVVDIADEFTLSTTSASPIEVATTAADTEPVVVGHYIDHTMAVTRVEMRAGYVWARIVPGSLAQSCLVVVT